MPKWTKAPEPLVALFTRALAALPDADTRSMFGYPAAFVRGQMFGGLFQRSMILRLSDDDRSAFVSEFHSKAFEPMPGRVMREYVVVPDVVSSSSAVLGEWLRKAYAYAAALPPKERRGARSGRRAKTR